MGDAFAMYGTSFENLEDEERDPVSKKPTAIQDQVATDERGRRRFHGAFTGGFSAGFFNTVGSKHGWAPSEFRSSRDDRAEKSKQRAEDFMDAEDLGEFGIASRRIRQTKDFATGPRLAWERGGGEQGAGAGTVEGLFAKDLQIAIRPVSDSAGVRMLRAMGWRQGRAVGLATVKEAKGSRDLSTVDREQITKIAPHWVASAEDEEVIRLTPAEGLKGLGYTGQLRGEGLLSEKYGQQAAAIKGKKGGRGIQGQAFGVGAFEDEDESVYTNFDLTQYDFSLGPGPEEKKGPSTPDSSFIPARSLLTPRRFFPPPRIPPTFKSTHTIRPIDPSHLPVKIQQAAAGMNALQRTLFLGENRKQMIKEAVGTRKRKSRWDVKPEDEDEEEWKREIEREENRSADRAKRVEFPNEPMKQARFKEFLNYVRRGLAMPQPTDLSHWEWETERGEFEDRLLPDERALLPDVRSRSKPLAQSALALPILDQMRSKFVGETNMPTPKNARDEDRLSAVKAEMFGERTRNKWDWHPSHGLAKMFNVPNPYPGSGIVGLPHLQNKGKRREEGMLQTIGLPNTAAEFAMRTGLGEERRREEERERRREGRRERRDEGSERDRGREKRREEDEEEEDEKENEEQRPPEAFFDAIFGMPSSSEDEEEEEKKEKGPAREEKGTQEITVVPQERVITVMDLADEYGPVAPPLEGGMGMGLAGTSALRLNEEIVRKMERRKRKAARREREKRTKKRKKSGKEKKSKKEKKERKKKKEKKSKKESKRRKQSSSSESDSSSESEWSSGGSSIQALD